MPKKVLIALPPAMLEQVDHIATIEHRTRSDLIREALRRYIDGFRRGQSARIANSASFSSVERQDVPVVSPPAQQEQWSQSAR